MNRELYNAKRIVMCAAITSSASREGRRFGNVTLTPELVKEKLQLNDADYDAAIRIVQRFWKKVYKKLYPFQ